MRIKPKGENKMSMKKEMMLKHIKINKVVDYITELPRKLDFEFMDSERMPASFRNTLRDILEVGNTRPFRNYYNWLSKSIYEYANEHQLSCVVELGAGCAPVTRCLSSNYKSWDVEFIVTDINPDAATFKELAKKDQRITPEFNSVDFSNIEKPYENSLLVLSGTFHHLPERIRLGIINKLKLVSPHIIICEPLRNTLSSKLFVVCALVSGLMTPFFRIRKASFFRTAFWCWILPLAPLAFLWDGWVSSFRCWDKKQWQKVSTKENISETSFCSLVYI